MSKDSLFAKLTRSFFGGTVVNFLDLGLQEAENQEGEVTDISKLKIHETSTSSPNLHILSDLTPKIPIIAIGGAGLKLLSKVVSRIEDYGMNYPTMGFDCEKSDLESIDNITTLFHIPGGEAGTSHQYGIASNRVSESREEVKNAMNDYITSIETSYKHEIVFMIMGSGGTGVGAGIEIAKILLEMGKRPVPFLILPGKEEMTRIRFNAAVALYYFSYAPKDRCLNLMTVCIDNERFLEKNSKKYYTSVISSANERIAATLGDIIATTELESHSFSADLNEFLEIFRDLKGLATLQYMHVTDPVRSLGELFVKNKEDSLSVKVDLLKATRGYLYISAPENHLLARDYRELLLEFDNADVFSKLYEIKSEDKFYEIRGIYTGIPYPSHIEELMQLAEDSRVTILTMELNNQMSGIVNPKIEKLDGVTAIDVKTGNEIASEKGRKFAENQRKGDDI